MVSSIQLSELDSPESKRLRLKRPYPYFGQDARQSTCVHRMEDPGLLFGLEVSCGARVPDAELGPTVGETWLIGRRRRIMVTPSRTCTATLLALDRVNDAACRLCVAIDARPVADRNVGRLI
jgi:hypothetical protein